MARKKIIKKTPRVLPKPIIKRERKTKKSEKPVEVTIHKTRTPVTGTTTTTPTPEQLNNLLRNIKYDGATVVSILAENETAKHCQMSDGTSKWIPKSVFNE